MVTAGWQSLGVGLGDVVVLSVQEEEDITKGSNGAVGLSDGGIVVISVNIGPSELADAGTAELVLGEGAA
jgi:hypothetical protein